MWNLTKMLLGRIPGPRAIPILTHYTGEIGFAILFEKSGLTSQDSLRGA